MAATMQLEVVSAEELLFEGKVQELIAPGMLGDMGVMPGHAQLISTLKPGELKYKTEEGLFASLFVSGGILEVQPKIVTVLADTAIRAHDLDEQRAKESHQLAEDALQGKDPQDMDYEAIRAELEAAKAQLEMIHRANRTIHG